jgi:type VI secretion system lysozyme-like protein
MEYLSLPLVPTEGHLDRTDLESSIAQSIGLVLSTRIGQIPFWPEYGCGIWDKEYADLLTTNKAEIRSAVRNAIAAFEPRMYNVTVSFDPESAAAASALGLKIRISGDFRDGDQEKKFTFEYQVG